MKTCIRKNCISLLLVITMIFTGMCFNDIKTDSIFSCAYDDSSASIIYSLNDDGSHPTVCTIEMLGSRSTLSALKPNRRSQETIGVKLHLCLSLQSNHLQNPLYTYMAVSGQPSADAFSLTVIVTYMHNQDGKKA